MKELNEYELDREKNLLEELEKLNRERNDLEAKKKAENDYYNGEIKAQTESIKHVLMNLDELRRPLPLFDAPAPPPDPWESWNSIWGEADLNQRKGWTFLTMDNGEDVGDDDGKVVPIKKKGK